MKKEMSPLNCVMGLENVNDLKKEFATYVKQHETTKQTIKNTSDNFVLLKGLLNHEKKHHSVPEERFIKHLILALRQDIRTLKTYYNEVPVVVSSEGRVITSIKEIQTYKE